VEAPWGGYKQSGIGLELGEWGYNNYLETKQITRYNARGVGVVFELKPFCPILAVLLKGHSGGLVAGLLRECQPLYLYRRVRFCTSI